jgi:glycosyltransferase involved in cell wall biosynthesis
MRILFFAESLIAGGQERRMLELIRYLLEKNDYTIALVITEEEIFYTFAKELDLRLEIIKRKVFRYDPLLFIRFFRFCRDFKPDIIHAWGKMPTFYSLPVRILLRIPLLSNLIANSKPEFNNRFMDKLFYSADVHFSDVILSNSHAGLKAYNIKSAKAGVIYNGVHLERFSNTFDIGLIRKELDILTELVVIMVACFTSSKDYDLFIDIAAETGKIRNDVTFVAVGGGPELNRIQTRANNEGVTNVVFTGDQKQVEPFVAAADVGLLCTYAEGVSNAIIEYMALGKPTVATDTAGGSPEITIEGVTGYCTERRLEAVLEKLIPLLDNKHLRDSMGEKGKERIAKLFSVNRMGEDYELIYKRLAIKN